MHTARGAWPALAIAAGAALLYFYRLGSAPIAVGGDESYFAIHAHAIATTGRDLDGRLLPLFFRIDIHTWYQPLLVYLMAAVFSVVRVSEAAMRTPTALIGVLNVVLVYAVALRLLGSRRHAAVAALVMALAPPHFILARQGLDYIAPLPFVLGSLWCLLAALDTGRARFAAGAGLLLGAGICSYVAAWVAMPVALLTTVVALSLRPRGWRLAMAAILGFSLPLLLLALWLRAEPDTVTTIMARYGFAGAGDGGSLMQSARGALRYYVMQRRLSLWWDYFDPVYLFVSGSGNVTLSTGTAGVLPMSCALLLPVGVYCAIRQRGAALIILAGFLLAPLAPIMIDSGQAIQRSLVTTGFGAVLSAIGAAALLTHTQRLRRTVAVLALVGIPLQFAWFARDYFGAYQVRSAGWIDPVNFAGVSDAVLSRDQASPVPRVYLSESLDDGEARWRFYLAKHGRDELWQRTWVIDPAGANVWSVFDRLDPVPLAQNPPPAGSVFVVDVVSPAMQRVTAAGACCTTSEIIHGPAGEPRTAIIQPRQLEQR